MVASTVLLVNQTTFGVSRPGTTTTYSFLGLLVITNWIAHSMLACLDIHCLILEIVVIIHYGFAICVYKRFLCCAQSREIHCLILER